MKSLTGIIGALALNLMLFSAALSQSNPGTIEGDIYDADTKAPLAGAHAIIMGSSIGAAADLNGRFVIHDVAVGSYSVRFSCVGYEPAIKTDVIVKPVRSTHIDAALRVSPFQAGEVKITPDYFGKPEDRNVSVVTFSYEEIRRAPGAAGDVSRIMMSLPSVGEMNDESNGLIVRGGSPVENGFFVYDIDHDNRLELLGIWGDDHNNPDAKTAVENDMVYYGNQDHYQSTNGINWRALRGDAGYSNTSIAFTLESFNDDSYETGSGLPYRTTVRSNKP